MNIMPSNEETRNLKQRAFTLIELLVVIAIIAILAAILFPVFAQAKLAAKKTAALSNAKQIATANLIYMGDYDDAVVKEFFGFPEAPACNWGGMAPGQPFYSWRYVMQPYTKSTGLLVDGTNPFAAPQYWTSANDMGTGSTADDFKTSSNFAVNTAIVGFANGACAGLGDKLGLSSLDGIEEPAATILFVPSRARWNDMPWSWGTLSGVLAGPTVADPYLGGSWCNQVNLTGAGVCPAAGNGPIHSVGKQSVFVWGDSHAKTKAYAATLRLADSNNDDWDSKDEIKNVGTGAKFTQADRVAAAAAGFFTEYK